jgi:hypothetical protein
MARTDGGGIGTVKVRKRETWKGKSCGYVGIARVNGGWESVCDSGGGESIREEEGMALGMSVFKFEIHDRRLGRRFSVSRTCDVISL